MARAIVATRQVTGRSVAELLLRRGPISRADLSKLSGFSKQTMSEVIGALEAEGMVRPMGRTNGNVGRTAITYDLVPGAAYAIGVDLGGSRIGSALVDVMGTIVAQASVATDRRGGAFILEQLRGIAPDLAAAGRVPLERVQQMVIASPGVVDHRSGTILMSPNLKGFDGINIGAALALPGLAVSVENNVNLALLGEHWQGGARGVRNAALLSIGNGAGLGFTANGVIVRGVGGAAGEIAYMPIGPEPTSQRALSNGALELEIGSAGIMRRYTDAGGGNVDSVAEIFERLRGGDAVAQKIIAETAQTLALAIATICAVIDPEVVILGGSTGSQPELIEATQAMLPKLSARPIRLDASPLSGRAGLLGALAVALNRLHYELFGASGTTGSEFQSDAVETAKDSTRIGKDILSQLA